MTIDWSNKGNVAFTMYDYLEDILAEEAADFDGDDVIPAISELISVNMTHLKPDAAMADLFHFVIAKFLYAAKRARSDLQMGSNLPV